MQTNSYSQTIDVHAPPDLVFRALIVDLGQWWKPVSNMVFHQGDRFTADFASSKLTFRIGKFVPSYLLQWECIATDQLYAEWIGTTAEWQLTAHDAGTTVQLTHGGLIPSLTCYAGTTADWDYHLRSRLAQHLSKYCAAHILPATMPSS